MNREQFKAPSVQAAAADLIANRALAQATRAEVNRIETALLATQPLRVNPDYLALGLVPSITNPTPPITDPAGNQPPRCRRRNIGIWSIRCCNWQLTP